MKNNKGFTLIEFLVVVGIVAILGAVAVVAVSDLAGQQRQQDGATTQEAGIPAPTGHVNDYAGLLQEDTEQALEASLKAFSPEVAVLTVQDMGGLSVEEYGIKVADAWKVGDKDKDDGVILIVSIGDRKVRIEVGYGSEGKINDAKAGRILDEKVIPHFKNGDWESGILEGVLAIKATLQN